MKYDRTDQGWQYTTELEAPDEANRLHDQQIQELKARRDQEKIANEKIYLFVTMGIKLLNEFMQNEDLQLIEIDTTASKVS